MVVRPDKYLIWMSFLPAVEQYEAETFLNPKFWNGTVATCLPRAMLKKQNRKAWNLAVSGFSTGPSGETWTHDPLTPSQVRYQLRYTRLFRLLLFRIGVSFVILARLQTKCKLFFKFFWKILKKIKMGWKGRGTDSQRQKRRRNDYTRFVAGFCKNGNKRKLMWGDWSDGNWGGGSFSEKGNSQNILDKLNVFL